jgi:hypothetical protein
MVDSREEADNSQAEQQQSREEAQKRNEHEHADVQELNKSMFHFITTFFTVLFAGLLVVSSFLTLGAIWAQVWVYNQQLKEMQKSTDAATKAAKAAETSVETAKDISRRDQRAWLTIRTVTMKTPLAVGQRPIIEVRFENTGRTPALNVQSAGAISSNQTVVRETLASRNRPIVGQTGRSIVGPNAGETGIYYGKEPIKDAGQIEAIRAETWIIYVSGSIRYDDIFGNHHCTTFCYGLSGREADAFRLSACFDGNEAD